MATTRNYNLPALSNEGGLSVYLAQIKKFPMLDAEEEYMLAKNWKTTGNIKAAEKLVTSHLRLVAKIAMGYKGYGLPINEMISEGNIMSERNIKIGVEFGWQKLFNGHHLISFRAGRNGPYNSVGWSLNLFGFKVDFAKYSEEVGGYAGELEDKRTSLQVSLIF